MNRRRLIQSASASSLLLPGASTAYANAAPPTPMASPQENLLDPRARNLIHKLQQLRPLQVLEALEASTVTEQSLVDAAGGQNVNVLPWSDMADTDLMESMGGALIRVGDTDIHSPDAVTLGGYIVFESAEIAYADLHSGISSLNNGSASYGGAVFFISDEGIAVGRLGYVQVIAQAGPNQPARTLDGVFDHLESVAMGL